MFKRKEKAEIDCGLKKGGEKVGFSEAPQIASVIQKCKKHLKMEERSFQKNPISAPLCEQDTSGFV